MQSTNTGSISVVNSFTYAHADSDAEAAVWDTSQTAVTSPENRSRTTVGVDEIVSLSASGENITWSLSGLGSLQTLSGSVTAFAADDHPGTAKISARGSDCTTSSLTFSVISPSGIIDIRKPGSGIRHTRGLPDVGILLDIYFQPDTVSFSRLVWYEKNAGCICTGYFKGLEDRGHQAHPVRRPLSDEVAGLGTPIFGWDQVYSAYTFRAPLYPPGTELWHIPTVYVGTGGAEVVFTTADQVTDLSHVAGEKGASRTLIAKAGGSGSANVHDPTSKW